MVNVIPVGDRVVHALNDGLLLPPPRYFDPPETFDRLVGADGEVRCPIGAFLWPGEVNVLVDAGLGPVDYGGTGRMVGGELLRELATAGKQPADIDIVALSHLHPDHAGWLASTDGAPTFPNATVVVGREDWQHFLVEHPDQIADHLAHALKTMRDEGRVVLVDGERDVAPGIRLIPAPGHTPGHSVYALHDHGERLLLLGDAIFCPLQLSEHELGTVSDLDPIAARRTREILARELERHESRAVGCHFPGLLAGRVVGSRWMQLSIHLYRHLEAPGTLQAGQLECFLRLRE